MGKALSVIALCCMGVLAAVNVSADTTTVLGEPETGMEGHSIAEEKSFLNRLGEKVAVNYFGIYRGASLTNFGSSLQPQVDGTDDPTNPQSLESSLHALYKVNKTWNAGILAHFYYYPIGNPVGTGQDLKMLDPSLLVTAPSIFTSGGLKLGFRFMAQLPISSSDDLQSRNVALGLTPMFILNYDVPHTRLTVGMVGYFKQYITTSSSPADVRTYKAYVAPNLSYQVSKTFAATLWVDWIQAVRSRGTPFFGGAENYYMDIEPGFNWDITNNISINPILNLYPANLSWASTSIQATIVARTG